MTATVTSPAFGTFNLGPDTVTVTATPVSITYTDNTHSNGTISGVSFISQTGGTNYSFTSANLNGAQIVPDRYAVTIMVSGGTQYVAGSGPTGPGYGCIGISGDCWNTCFTYLSTNTYTATPDLSTCTTLAIASYQASNCP